MWPRNLHTSCMCTHIYNTVWQKALAGGNTCKFRKLDYLGRITLVNGQKQNMDIVYSVYLREKTTMVIGHHFAKIVIVFSCQHFLMSNMDSIGDCIFLSNCWCSSYQLCYLYRMVEGELLPCLRHLNIRFYSYNIVSCVVLYMGKLVWKNW